MGNMNQTIDTTRGTCISLKEAHAPLIEAVQAVDALNSWVRSPGFRSHTGSHAKRAVYWLKRCAIKVLHEADAECDRKSGSVQEGNYQALDSFVSAYGELVFVPAACRTCDGTGVFRSWRYVGEDTEEADRTCNRCHGRGTVGLFFVLTKGLFNWETSIHWHTPAEEYLCWPKDAFPRPVNTLPHSTNWEPNQTGRNLTPSEAAAFLNCAETYFTDRPKPEHRYVGGGQYTSQPVDDFAYHLYLGQTKAGLCCLCGAVGNVSRPAAEEAGVACLSRCGKSEKPFQWTALVCESCHKSRPGFWDELTVPDYLITPPIREWATRHVALQGSDGRHGWQEAGGEATE